VDITLFHKCWDFKNVYRFIKSRYIQQQDLEKDKHGSTFPFQNLDKIEVLLSLGHENEDVCVEMKTTICFIVHYKSSSACRGINASFSGNPWAIKTLVTYDLEAFPPRVWRRRNFSQHLVINRCSLSRPAESRRARTSAAALRQDGPSSLIISLLAKKRQLSSTYRCSLLGDPVLLVCHYNKYIYRAKCPCCSPP